MRSRRRSGIAVALAGRRRGAAGRARRGGGEGAAEAGHHRHAQPAPRSLLPRGHRQLQGARPRPDLRRAARAGGLSRPRRPPGGRRPVGAAPHDGGTGVVRRRLRRSRGRRARCPTARWCCRASRSSTRATLDIANVPWEAYWVRAKSPQGPVDFLTAHFASSSNNPPCTETLARRCARPGSRPTSATASRWPTSSPHRTGAALTVVGGDLNATPDEPTVAHLRDAGFVDAWLAAGKPECDAAHPAGCTAGGTAPDPWVGMDTQAGAGFDERIDYVWVKPGAAARCASRPRASPPHRGRHRSTGCGGRPTTAVCSRPCGVHDERWNAGSVTRCASPDGYASSSRPGRVRSRPVSDRPNVLVIMTDEERYPPPYETGGAGRVPAHAAPGPRAAARAEPRAAPPLLPARPRASRAGPRCSPGSTRRCTA